MSYSIIKSEFLEAKIRHYGAELCELKIHGHDHNWIWSGKSLWFRHAPILFPIVGKLLDDSYLYEGKAYTLSQHGFARDSLFDVVHSTGDRVRLRLKSTVDSFRSYPFEFQLDVEFWLEGNYLILEFEVFNKDVKDIYFNIGWHPGFVLPSQKRFSEEIFAIESSSILNSYYSLVGGHVNINNSQEIGIEDGKVVVLSEEILSSDALVFLDSCPSILRYYSKVGSEAIELNCGGAKHLGVWSKSPSDFLCIEPWWGYADPQMVSGVISEKPGIQRLGMGEVWTDRVWVRIL